MTLTSITSLYRALTLKYATWLRRCLTRKKSNYLNLKRWLWFLLYVNPTKNFCCLPKLKLQPAPGSVSGRDPHLWSARYVDDCVVCCCCCRYAHKDARYSLTPRPPNLSCLSLKRIRLTLTQQCVVPAQHIPVRLPSSVVSFNIKVDTPTGLNKSSNFMVVEFPVRTE